MIKDSYSNSDGTSGISEYALVSGEYRMVKEVWNYIREDGSVDTYTYEYSYDVKGNKIKETCLDSDGDTRVDYYAVINGEERVVKRVGYYKSSDGSTYISYYKTIDCGSYRMEVEVKYVYTHTNDDGSAYTSTYEYDENGDCVKTIWIDSDGVRHEY